MAAFRNIKSITQISKLFNNAVSNRTVIPANTVLAIRNLSTTKCLGGLMEFFDDEKNWGVNEVKTGKSWSIDELRIKSNSDLHKLWFVLLKERNMLLTMEEESKEETRLFPSPERIDKVEVSMDNLEAVVKERNKAYFELETGETGERKVEEIMGPFGLPVQHEQEEYLIPKHMNAEWQKKHVHDVDNADVKKFVRLYKEKEMREKRQQQTRDFNHVIGLLKRFPDMDMEALKAKYPDVDIDKAKRSRKCRGHFVPK
ncbi:PREDICTED: 39S ribosomal protein L47, mitochondrial [Nicrophorus vespilloides]|uniref:Large ribosomal subunit protein uL29m n=1 Tax=Nicrophorus vespilloides TaxID=110193 RepID=A0ABM1MID5_NICVS|nr:PREDICTED: 39S ribosomal protein L47, mitochondrial [Nicrophorus vespilloides]